MCDVELNCADVAVDQKVWLSVVRAHVARASVSHGSLSLLCGF